MKDNMEVGIEMDDNEKLVTAILTQAVTDAKYTGIRKYYLKQKIEAINWIMTNDPKFDYYCKLINIGKLRDGLFSVVVEMNILRPMLLFLKSNEIRPDITRVLYAITNGAGVMPAYEGQLSTEEIEAVSHYVSISANQ